MISPAPVRRIDLPLAEHRLCARVARLYYEAGLTQEQIGQQLGLSRMKVNRLIQVAMRAGVVEIQIHGPDEPNSELAHELESAFGLREARIATAPSPEQDLRAVLAATAADWLAERLADDQLIGVGLGRTVALIPSTFSLSHPVACRFVTLEGVGVSPNAGFAAYDVTSRLADAAGGRAEVISAPTFVSSSAVRDALIAEPTIRASLDLARRADLMIQSVGTVTPDALLFRHGTLTEVDLGELREAGAVGDALGHFFDANGADVPWRTDGLHVGLTLDDIRQCPTSAIVAGGADKAVAIRAALRGRVGNVLITDAVTAQHLLEIAA